MKMSEFNTLDTQNYGYMVRIFCRTNFMNLFFQLQKDLSLQYLKIDLQSHRS